MFSLLLLLIFAQDDLPVKAAPREDVEAIKALASTKAQLESTREELKKAVEAIAENRVRQAQADKALDLAAKANKRLSDTLEKEQESANLLKSKLQETEIDVQELRVAAAQKPTGPAPAPEQTNILNTVLPITIMGLSAVDNSDVATPIVQWHIITSPGCRHCGPFIDSVRALKGWTEGADRSHFRIITITQAEWDRRGLTLPRAELWVGSTMVREENPHTMRPFNAAALANIWNDEHLKQEKLIAGVSVGTLEIKPQVIEFLKSMERFLDGGKLNITYTPRAGVVKEYLTIQHGAIGIRIPAKTSLDITMNKQELGVAFATPTPLIRLPVRGDTQFKSLTLSGNKLAVQLPWMIDPEWVIK